MNETEQLHGAASRFSEMKILIIDDELANVALLEDLLSNSGYTQVKSIMDPRLSIQTCDEFEPDVVLLDLRMPHMDGSPFSKPCAQKARVRFSLSSC